MGTLFLTKEARIYNRAKTPSSIKSEVTQLVLGKLDSYMWKNEIRTHLPESSPGGVQWFPSDEQCRQRKESSQVKSWLSAESRLLYSFTSVLIYPKTNNPLKRFKEEGNDKIVPGA